MDKKYWNAIKDNPKLLEYLNNFNEEYVNASFRPNKKHIHKRKAQRRDSYNRNNARNRCIYTREKAQGKLDFIEDLKAKYEEETIDYEKALITALDENLMLEKEINNLNKSSDDPDDSTGSDT